MVVRAFWGHLASAGEPPLLLRGALLRDEGARERKKDALKALAGIGEGPYSHLSDEELNAIYLSRHEGRSCCQVLPSRVDRPFEVESGEFLTCPHGRAFCVWQACEFRRIP